MPSSLAQPEAVARAVLEKTPATPPPPGSAQEAAAKIRESLQQDGPRSTLESLRQQRPIEQRKVDEILDKNIGVERDASGRKDRTAGSAEARRFQEAQQDSSLTKEFLERGYDRLTPTQKSDLSSRVERSIMVWPEGSAILSSMTPVDKQATIAAILKNPDYIAKLRGVFDEAVDPTKIIKEDALIEAKRQFEETQRREAGKNVEIARNTGEKTAIDNQLDQFADRTAIGGVKGVKLQELEGIERDLPTLTTDLITKQDQVADINARIRDLEYARRATLGRGGDTTQLEVELGQRRSDARDLQREITTINNRVTRKSILEREKSELEQKRQQLMEERDRLNGELQGLSQDRARLQAGLASEQLTRASQEEDFVEGIKSTFSEAAFRYLEGQITAADKVRDKLLEEEIQKVTDPDEKKVLEAFRVRWEKQEWKKGRSVFPLNRDQIRQDYGNLITGGPNKVLKDILREGVTYTPGSPAWLVEVARIDAKLQDPNFINKMAPQLAERLITRQIKVGKITEDDVRIIRESDWGQGMVNKAIENNKALKDELEQLYGKGVVESGSFWQSLKKASNGSILKLLLLLLGTAALGAVPIGMSIKSSLNEQ